MNVFLTDSQVVGETSSVLFGFFPASSIPYAITLQNVGTNTLNYTAAGSNDGGVTWVNLDQPGGPSNNSLVSGQVTTFVVNASYNQIEFTGNASGGSILQFAMSRYYARQSGAFIPILSQ